MAANSSKGRFFPVPGVHLGIATDPRAMNSVTLPFDIPQGAGSTSTFGIGGGLGQVYEQDGRVYRLVQYIKGTNGTNCIDGGVAYWSDKSAWTVTCDASDGEALAAGVAGGTHVAITVASQAPRYIFVQIGGDQAAVAVAGSTVAGDALCGHASTDNVLTRTAAGTASIDIQSAIALTTRGTTTTDNGASLGNSSKVRWVLGNLL